jgi:transcriptional regulator with XRE-family HTH domain
MEDGKKQIGSRVRLLRLQQNRTLADIAGKCSFSSSLLSKIENGKAVPSVGSLVKIAGALGTSVSAILDADKDVKSLFTSKETVHQSMIATEKGIDIYPFATEHRANKMQPFLHRAERGKTVPRTDSHEGQEFIFVLQGSLKFKVGSVEYTLNEGDSLYFNSIEMHEGTPLTDVVEYLDIFV